MIVIDRDTTPRPDRCPSFVAPPPASMELTAEIPGGME